MSQREPITDEALEGLNDASAAAMTGERLGEISPVTLYKLVCEVQAWRRACPDGRFVPGPNLIKKNY